MIHRPIPCSELSYLLTWGSNKISQLFDQAISLSKLGSTLFCVLHQQKVGDHLLPCMLWCSHDRACESIKHEQRLLPRFIDSFTVYFTFTDLMTTQILMQNRFRKQSDFFLRLAQITKWILHENLHQLNNLLWRTTFLWNGIKRQMCLIHDDHFDEEDRYIF